MILEREEFVKLSMPTVINGDTKNVVPAVIELLPNNTCIYREDKYSISTNEDGQIVLLRINRI